MSAALPGSPTVTNCRLVWPLGMLNTSALAELAAKTTIAAKIIGIRLGNFLRRRQP